MKTKTITSRFNTEEPEELDKIIRSSYDDFVRLERRNLIIISGIILISFFGDANPNDLALFGFKFPNLNTELLFTIMSLVCLYFLIAFMIYSYPNFRESRKTWKNLISNTMTATGQFHRFHIELVNALSTSRYLLWLVFQYIFPVFLGLTALIIGIYKIA